MVWLSRGPDAAVGLADHLATEGRKPELGGDLDAHRGAGLYAEELAV